MIFDRALIQASGGRLLVMESQSATGAIQELSEQADETVAMAISAFV